jgi:prevent-host-death family protein
MNTTAKDLRFNAKGVLETVSRGEEVVITFRGKPCAKIVPYKKKVKNTTKKNELFGIWQDNPAVENVNDYVQNLRKARS